ncbi:hypothetical protein DVH05_014944 [Phytophthora capsici]|nr:hypothetical protein DVH05_014944 [Phytophthora capsici]
MLVLPQEHGPFVMCPRLKKVVLFVVVLVQDFLAEIVAETESEVTDAWALLMAPRVVEYGSLCGGAGL